MKKPYSLDYNIERDIDRVQAVYDILDTLATDPSPTELEQMASYILYGKDENGYNAVQRGETIDTNKRYSTFKSNDDKVMSLEALQEDSTTEIQPANHPKTYLKRKPTIQHPKYNKKTGELIDPGDSDIPGMQELWDRIAHLEHIAAVNEGKVAADPDTQIFYDDYRFYQFKHMLIDVRRHQYYLKDAYKPTLFFPGVDHPKQQFIDWTCDSYYWVPLDLWKKKVAAALLSSVSSDLKDYETREENGQIYVKWIVRRHTFDWENPLHVRAFIQYYDQLYEQLRDKLDTYGRALLFDFERYIAAVDLTPSRRFILTEKMRRQQHSDIIRGLQNKFDITYNETHISSILSKEIPEKIASYVKKERLINETPEKDKKRCYTCGRLLPRDPLFFGRNRSRKDGWSSNCKECEKARRIKQGGQSQYDRRSKDAKVLEMQANEARN